MEQGTKRSVFCPLSSSMSVTFLLLLLCQQFGVIKGCNQEMIVLENVYSQSVITSLYYPDQYPPNLDCNFYITAPSGRRVRLYFTSFDVEVATTYNRCAFDYVIIYDGDSNADAEFGRFCGTIQPPTIVSSGRHLHVHFHTDGSVQETGFRAVVHSVESSYQEPLPTNAPGSCYSLLEEDNGIFYSPGFPGSYDHNQDCSYIVVLPNENDHVMLRFTSFDLEPSQNCVYDFVEVRDGVSSATPLIGRYCGGFNQEPSGVIETTGPGMYVLFHTDVSAAFEGFYAEYATSSVGFLPGTSNEDSNLAISVCDISRAILTMRGGFIVSHDNYPQGTYDHHSRCSIQITGSRTYEKVFIDFLAVDLPVSSAGCGGRQSDYIEVLDGQVNANPTTMVTLCESAVGSYVSSSSYAVIRFRTDGATNSGHNGFKAVFVVFYEDAYGCENSDYHCENNRCIAPSLVCDGYDHCGDNSDEDQGCVGEKDFTWLIVLGIVAGSLLLILLGICTGCCFMNSQATRRAPGSTADRSRPSGNGTAIPVVSSQSNGVRQPYTYQNPVFSTGPVATVPPASGQAEAAPPKYSDIWKDPINVPPPQGRGVGNGQPLPPAPAPTSLYAQREMAYAASSAPPLDEATPGSPADPVLPPAEFQSEPLSQGVAGGMGGPEEPLGRAQVIRQPRGGTLPPLRGVHGRPADTP
ncbi:cubilin homolog [Acanthaster planci]|uniref:Cubilin homolog n=1 Tax=Acanthaster planci TaxID=133434 RepID=A0A8B7YQ27_ACAPL|nr:cubilin homolog [Acanthaster planci]XP_022094554.1 cubilin homolog [Acanthaster planci]XP_022094555.1 cubilin homolog [Acanthaster planci]